MPYLGTSRVSVALFPMSIQQQSAGLYPCQHGLRLRALRLRAGGEGSPSGVLGVPEGTLALVVDHKIRYVRTLEYRNIPAVIQVWIGAMKGASFDIHYMVLGSLLTMLG